MIFTIENPRKDCQHGDDEELCANNEITTQTPFSEGTAKSTTGNQNEIIFLGKAFINILFLNDRTNKRDFTFHGLQYLRKIFNIS
jgi:hypothetical protein